METTKTPNNSLRIGSPRSLYPYCTMSHIILQTYTPTCCVCRDPLKQHRAFIVKIAGQSKLTVFSACQAETAGSGRRSEVSPSSRNHFTLTSNISSCYNSPNLTGFYLSETAVSSSTGEADERLTNPAGSDANKHGCFW
ncbi:hypothetical protein PoB_005015200 [Plakobranchus ocellatus]|uniref:Uncharacterized protein n=1 Tax=Plakobranchus ocellatus TaxID=259542 RepID=A0AAV4BWY6_9GAST|nr:hypothetical protein PoB_005015200 [Plakobranchus ocellatus]